MADNHKRTFSLWRKHRFKRARAWSKDSHLAVPVLHQQDQVLQLGWTNVHEVPPQLREAGGVLAPLTAAVQEGRVGPGLGVDVGLELPCECEGL